VEQFAGHCHIVAIAADIQETTQDRTVCSQLSRLLPAATSDTCFFFFFLHRSHIFFKLFFFVRCPRSLWHYATLISSFNNNNNSFCPTIVVIWYCNINMRKLIGVTSIRPNASYVPSITVIGNYTTLHTFNGPLYGTTQVSRYQKGKTDLDFTEARDSEWHQLGCMQVCTSIWTDNHASTPPLSFLQAGCPFCCPTNSIKAHTIIRSLDLLLSCILDLRLCCQ